MVEAVTSAAATVPGPNPDQAVLGPPVVRPSRRARLLTTVARHRSGLLAGLLFALLAGWLTHGLWPAPGQRVLALNPADQTLYEWFLAVDSRALLGDFHLLTDRLNAPDGVNLLANTTVIALGVLFAPVTLAFGAPVSFALLTAGNLAGTALAWYLLFSRTLRVHRLAAGLGAIAGALVAPQLTLTPGMMDTALVYALAAVILGGLSSPIGVVVAAWLIGVLENLAAVYVPFIGYDLKVVVPFVLIFIVLLVRPQGLFGRKAVVRV